MRFSIFAGLFTLLSFVSIGYAGDCAIGPYAPKSAVGNLKNGAITPTTPSFCWSEYDQGRLIIGIKVWYIRWHIKGIEVKLSNGETRMMGVRDSSGGGEPSISWEGTKERVKSMKMWSNKNQDALGFMTMELTNGTKFEAGNQKETHPPSGTEIAVGDGTLIGASGHNSGFIMQLTWLFLNNPIVEAKIIDVEYAEKLEEWNKEARGIKEQTLQDLTFDNCADSNMTWSFTNEVDVTRSKTLTQSYTHTLGATVDVTVGSSVGVPEVASVKAEVKIGASYSFATSKSTSKTDTSTQKLTWSTGGTSVDVIKPWMAKRCISTSYRGDFQSKYTSTVRVTMADGNTFDMKQTGNYLATTWTDARAVCYNVPVAKCDKQPRRAVEFIS